MGRNWCGALKHQGKFVYLGMTTVTIDILNDKALNLLRNLELLKLIRLRKTKEEPHVNEVNLVAKYKGAMTSQPLDEIDQQLKGIRGEWE